jgi:hypothetical protein
MKLGTFRCDLCGVEEETHSSIRIPLGWLLIGDVLLLHKARGQLAAVQQNQYDEEKAVQDAIPRHTCPSCVTRMLALLEQVQREAKR